LPMCVPARSSTAKTEYVQQCGILLLTPTRETRGLNDDVFRQGVKFLDNLVAPSPFAKCDSIYDPLQNSVEMFGDFRIALGERNGVSMTVAPSLRDSFAKFSLLGSMPVLSITSRTTSCCAPPGFTKSL
jgi:hypothetical protein